MSDVFRDERAEAATGGRLALFRLWSRTLRGFASVAPREHAQILARDAAYGLRLMRKHPLTTAAAIFSIALGVGANTAMFTVVNAVLLQFPFKDPERVVTVLRQTPRGRSAGFTEAQFRAWTGRVDALDSLSGYSMLSPILTGAGSRDAPEARVCLRQHVRDARCRRRNRPHLHGARGRSGRRAGDRRQPRLLGRSLEPRSERHRPYPHARRRGRDRDRRDARGVRWATGAETAGRLDPADVLPGASARRGASAQDHQSLRAG